MHDGKWVKNEWHLFKRRALGKFPYPPTTAQGNLRKLVGGDANPNIMIVIETAMLEFAR
ncbi:hypothetical protein GCM10010981_24080 [Dyella nitratireducens]|uniref:Uncharacterized protein n=1 Tax=Dyella nitratireducens TaxID=1849580 RepID=A0ABQ1G0F6_9GAMM|nr:hypothetical protein GCM10010981_24080 [Dyella nitratireducens]GLQ40842.1 hypothetical protein GCM10007902_06920 [Dyella nitratireducens]